MQISPGQLIGHVLLSIKLPFIGQQFRCILKSGLDISNIHLLVWDESDQFPDNASLLFVVFSVCCCDWILREFNLLLPRLSN